MKEFFLEVKVSPIKKRKIKNLVDGIEWWKIPRERK
jgi:hypothetical protein